MKKSIVSAALMLSVCAGLAFSQTRKPVVRRKKTTVVKKVVPPKKAVIAVKKSPAVTTASGLTYIVTQNGTGAPLKAGDTVLVHYTGLLTNGFKFDSSLDRGEPILFRLGAGEVIKGWDEGIQKLRVGDRATLLIPPGLGYGSTGEPRAGIPPEAMLIFIVEVVGVR